MKKNRKSFSLYNKELHIVEKHKIWFTIPVIIVLTALIEFFCFAGVNNWDFSKGINIGIDFTGGTSMTVMFGDDYTDAKLDEVASVVEKFGVSVSYKQKTGTGSESAVMVKYKNIHADDETSMKLNDEIQAKLEETFPNKEVSYSSVGSTASKELLSTAFLSIFVVAICIFIYIIFRFELWSGLSAIIALMHDLIVMFSLTLIFRIEINAPFIAALITILAYSINDTIIVFDRIRESIKMNTEQKINYTAIANKAIASTMTRSLYTSITTLMTIVVVAICVPQIRDFALPIIFGIMSGTFSSIFIASPIFVAIKNSLSNSKKAKAEKALAIASGVEYVQESDYDLKKKYWNKLKDKLTGKGNVKKSFANVTSTDGAELTADNSTAVETGNTESVKTKKNAQKTPYVNVKKKKKQNK